MDVKGLELWGGHECSVIRVYDEYRDQTVLTGHQHRLTDLERFAILGTKALRYPVLWERVSPDAPEQRDFSWSDERLAEVRRLGMRPIIGLSHHGSGPRYTSLVDESFALGLAAHARAVAERYPWVFAAGGRNLVMRTGSLFSCDEPRNFAMQILDRLSNGTPIIETDDCYHSLTYAADLVDAVLDLLIDGETGVWHVAQPGRMSGAEFARTLAEHAGWDVGAVRAVPAMEMGWRVRWPRDVALASVRGNLLSETLPAMDRFLADTHHPALRKTPHPSVDLRDPVLADG